MRTPRHDWFLKEWLRASNKKQADLVNDLEWNKAKASLLAGCRLSEAAPKKVSLS
jgi:hypothetical protein